MMTFKLKATPVARTLKRLSCLGLVSGVLTLQGCAIPFITTKQADTALPKQFVDQPADDLASTANLPWQTFFEDPQLIALLDIAVAHNKELNIMAQRISQAQNEIQARRGEYLPFVRFGAGIDKEKVGTYTRNGAVEERLEIKEGKAFPRYLGNYQFGLSAQWELDVWQKLRNATKVAVTDYMATIEGQHFLVTNLVAEVANAYYELVALDNALQTLEQNIQIQKSAYEVVQQLQQYGRANALAVKRFDAEVRKNQSKQFVLKQQIVATENRLNNLLGRTPQPIARTALSMMSLTPKMVSSGLPSDLLANRPDVRRAALALSASQLNIAVAKANFYPSFTMRAGIGFQAFNPKYLLNLPESLMASVGGDLMAPLINRNAIEAQYKNASAQQIEAAYDYEQTIINAYTEVSTQLTNIQNLDQNYQLKTKQVDALTQSIDVANQLFKAARADYMEVLLTQRDALEAKMELIETKQQRIAAMVNLYRALGGGWH